MKPGARPLATFEATLEQYQPLLHKLTRKWPIPGVDYEDGFQIATIGLWRAWSTYRADRGASFLTHAHRCVTTHLQAAVKRPGRRKRIPPSEVVSLDHRALGGEGSEFIDSLEAADGVRPDVIVERRDLIAHCIDDPSERNRAMLYLAALGYSDYEISERFGVTDKRVQQIRRRAIERVRRAA